MSNRFLANIDMNGNEIKNCKTIEDLKKEIEELKKQIQKLNKSIIK